MSSLTIASPVGESDTQKGDKVSDSVTTPTASPASSIRTTAESQESPNYRNVEDVSSSAAEDAAADVSASAAGSSTPAGASTMLRFEDAANRLSYAGWESVEASRPLEDWITLASTLPFEYGALGVVNDECGWTLGCTTGVTGGGEVYVYVLSKLDASDNRHVLLQCVKVPKTTTAVSSTGLAAGAGETSQEQGSIPATFSDNVSPALTLDLLLKVLLGAMLDPWHSTNSSTGPRRPSELTLEFHQDHSAAKKSCFRRPSESVLADFCRVLVEQLNLRNVRLAFDSASSEQGSVKASLRHLAEKYKGVVEATDVACKLWSENFFRTEMRLPLIGDGDASSLCSSGSSSSFAGIGSLFHALVEPARRRAFANAEAPRETWAFRQFFPSKLLLNGAPSGTTERRPETFLKEEWARLNKDAEEHVNAAVNYIASLRSRVAAVPSEKKQAKGYDLAVINALVEEVTKMPQRVVLKTDGGMNNTDGAQQSRRPGQGGSSRRGAENARSKALKKMLGAVDAKKQDSNAIDIYWSVSIDSTTRFRPALVIRGCRSGKETASPDVLTKHPVRLWFNGKKLEETVTTNKNQNSSEEDANYIDASTNMNSSATNNSTVQLENNEKTTSSDVEVLSFLPLVCSASPQLPDADEVFESLLQTMRVVGYRPAGVFLGLPSICGLERRHEYEARLGRVSVAVHTAGKCYLENVTRTLAKTSTGASSMKDEDEATANKEIMLAEYRKAPRMEPSSLLFHMLGLIDKEMAEGVPLEKKRETIAKLAEEIYSQ
ncbi:unnamed protein product [Amoebophrya sp. A25]|nr:unnamed protein product [Amoebophrya sp. A25]|eukprot:GSA25T00018974001.1